MKKRGFIELTGQEWESKFSDYEKDSNTDKFLKETSKPKKEKVDLTAWCEKNKALNYKYEPDTDFQRLVKWCYKKSSIIIRV